MNDNKYKIAIVDDENEILTMISKFLNRSGKYDVSTYTNPIVAINAIGKDTDLILLDIMMPQMNGLDALEKILANNPKQKVIMMTAYSTLDKVLNSHKEGAVHYLMKPFDSLSILENKIDEVLNT